MVQYNSHTQKEIKNDSHYGYACTKATSLSVIILNKGKFMFYNYITVFPHVRKDVNVNHDFPFF